MANDFEDNRKKTNVFLHSVYDFSMGVLWLCLGGFFLLHEKFGIELNIDKVLTTIFGVAAVLYGAFRLYRGFRKNY